MREGLKKEFNSMIHKEIQMREEIIDYISSDIIPISVWYNSITGKAVYIKENALLQDGVTEFLEKYFIEYLHSTLDIDIKYLHNSLIEECNDSLLKETILVARKVFTRKELLSDILSDIISNKSLIERMFNELIELQLPKIREDLEEYKLLLSDLRNMSEESVLRMKDIKIIKNFIVEYL